MRRSFFCLALAAVLCISATGCGKSDKAAEVDALIASVGKVTKDSEAAIIEAEEAVNELGKRYRKELERLDELKAARAEFNSLMAEDAEEAIAAIGEVTLDSGEAIEAAREAYDDCREDIKPFVGNYGVLEAAEKRLTELKVAEVSGLIDAIGEVTAESGASVSAAKDAYAALTPEEKEEVKNADALTEASERLKELLLPTVTAPLDITEDDAKEITWYAPRVMPSDDGVRSYVLPYIGQQDGETWLRLQYHYTGADWIFFTEVTVEADGQSFTRSFNYNRVTRNNSGGVVWEYIDLQPAEEDMEILEAIAGSAEATVRFQGELYNSEMTVSAEDRQAVGDVLAAWEVLK